MKKLIAMLIAVSSFVGVNAQDFLLNNPDNKGYFGVRAGLDISCPGDLKMNGIGVDAFGTGAGFSVGAIYNAPIVANFYIEPGLSFYYDTYSVNKDYMDEDVEITGASVRKAGMRIPVMAGYHFDFAKNLKLSVFTGPEFEIGFSAKMHAESGSVSASESLYGDDGMKRFDMLWRFGAGLTINRCYVGVSGGIGMLDLDGSDVSFHENVVSITLGYNF